MNWVTFITQLAISASAIPAIAWLTKSLLSQQLAKDLEAYRASLAAETERDRVRYSKLHERRAEVIEHVYKQLVNITALFRMQQGEHSKNAAHTADVLNEEVISAAQYFGHNALYFNAGVKQKFHKIFVEALPKPLLMVYGLGEMEKFQELVKARFGDKADVDLRGPFLAAIKEQLPMLAQLTLELEAEFKVLLGVEQ